MTESAPDRISRVEGPCPCGTSAAYDRCCGPLHRGDAAPTAERLMRSRYSAFVLEDAAHLLRSWHPDTRPPRVDFDDDTVWRRLQVVDTVAGKETDDTGVVEFRAAFRDASGATALHERSRFVRNRGLWVYLDGDLLD